MEEEEEEIKAPTGTVFTLIVPLDREKTKFATFFLKDIDESLYLAVKELIGQKKLFDATRLMISQMSLEGSSPASMLKGNLIAVNSAASLMIEIITPLDGELKKN